MAKYVIDIPQDIYELCKRDKLHYEQAELLENQVANSTPLEKVLEDIKAEPILDKIKEEINSPNRGTCDYFIVDRIEEIIDKYKVESEDK